MGKLFREIERYAEAEKVQDIFISTNHTGLYEKYECEFYQMMQMGSLPEYMENILTRKKLLYAEMIA